MSDLTLPSTVALELGVDASHARLPRLISAASGAIAAYLGRPLAYESARVERVAGYGRERLILALSPVLSVASVVLRDGSTVALSEVSIEAEAGMLYRAAGWPWTGVLRAGLLPSDPLMGSEAEEITITYAGGWVTPAQALSSGWAGPARSLPYEIEEAAVQTAVGLFRRGGADPLIASEALGDYSVSYRALDPASGAGVLPEAALALLAPYRRAR